MNSIIKIRAIKKIASAVIDIYGEGIYSANVNLGTLSFQNQNLAPIIHNTPACDVFGAVDLYESYYIYSSIVYTHIDLFSDSYSLLGIKIHNSGQYNSGQYISYINKPMLYLKKLYPLHSIRGLSLIKEVWQYNDY